MTEDPHILLTLFRQGDEESFRQIFEEYYHLISRFACSLIKDSNDASDIVSDVFVGLYRKREEFDSIAYIRAFLFISTRNACFNYLRHQKVKANHRDTVLSLGEDEETDSSVKEEYFNLLTTQIKNLPPQRRRIVEMCFLEGMDRGEIAQRLGVERNTVNSQIRHAITDLRAGLRKGPD